MSDNVPPPEVPFGCFSALTVSLEVLIENPALLPKALVLHTPVF